MREVMVTVFLLIGGICLTMGMKQNIRVLKIMGVILLALFITFIAKEVISGLFNGYASPCLTEHSNRTVTWISLI